jgi:hypothetical protein
MTKRKKNYLSSLIQTKRNPTNARNHDAAVSHALVLKLKADVHNFHSQQNHKKYA